MKLFPDAAEVAEVRRAWSELGDAIAFVVYDHLWRTFGWIVGAIVAVELVGAALR